MNNKLSLYVCANFAEDYRHALSPKDSELVEIKTYPCLCLKPSNRYLAKELITSDTNNKIIICGCHYDMFLSVGVEEDLSSSTFKPSNYCFNHLTSESLIEFILEKGGYILTTGWLKTWRERLDYQGFNQEIARRFYGEFCKELILLDTNIDKNIEDDLKEFSNYLDIPYRILSIGLDHLKLYMGNCIHEWQISKLKENHQASLTEKNRKIADYAAILHVIEQLAFYTRKREIVDKIKHLFTFIFGAKQVLFIDDISNSPEELDFPIADLAKKTSLSFIDASANQMIIKLVWNDETLGFIIASDFTSIPDLNRYSEFAQSISHFFSLALSNATKYELLEKSRDESAYNNNHDTLTGLYNRTFYKQFISENYPTTQTAVFVCDIDGLKNVNDTYGHVIGDEMIQSMAKVLSNSFRESDVVCRVGGDEFYILMFNCNEQGAALAKERIQYHIDHQNNLIQNRPFHLSLSVGYLMVSDMNVDSDWDTLVVEADKRMYFDKNQKKMAKQQ